MTASQFVATYDAVKGPSIHWNNEADIQEGIFQIAWICGWNVRREVHVPGWGRVDLILSNDLWSWAVELKTDLRKPRDIRRALQQADGYRRALPEVAQVILAASNLGPDLADYSNAYPTVRVLSIGQLLGALQQGNLLGNRLRADERYEDLKRQTAMAAAHYIRISPDLDPTDPERVAAVPVRRAAS